MKILECFNMQHCNPIDTPVMQGDGLSTKMCPKTPEERKEMVIVPYASVVGSLMYVMMCARPNICHDMGLVSRYQSNSDQVRCKVVKRILKYLKGTMDYRLCY